MSPPGGPARLNSKSILRLLHPRVSLTERESNVLLRTVQDSFREKLATAHEPSTAPYSSPNAHLGNVLKMAPFAASPEENRAARERRIKLYLDDPITLFDEHVALGTASAVLARSCLHRCTSGKPHYSTRGSRVLKGLLTAGLLQRPSEFLHDAALTESLIPALVSEDKTGSVVNWIMELERTESGWAVLPQRLIRHVLRTHGPERAVETFFSFYDRLVLELPRTTHLLSIAGLKLVRLTTDAQQSASPNQLFDRLFDTALTWSVDAAQVFAIKVRYDDRIEPAIKLFCRLDDKSDYYWRGLSEKTKLKYIRAAVELGQKCLKKGNIDAARRIGYVLQKRFSDHAGSGERAMAQELPEREAGDYLHVFRGMFKDAIRKEEQFGAAAGLA